MTWLMLAEHVRNACAVRVSAFFTHSGPLLRSRRSRMLAGIVGVLAALGTTAGIAISQRGMFIEPNIPYDGRFTFVRLRYQVYNRSGWEFDYPAMERNFMTILNDLSTIKPHVTESNVLTMDDPALAKYPIAYLSEPGFWIPDDREAEGLRKWLAKGGFLIVDDFLLNQWDNFERSMKKVLPNAKIERLDVKHPIFDSFYTIKTLDGMSHPDRGSYAPAEYYGIYEENDPTRRLMVIINYNNDIGDYMEWSGEGWYPINLSNDAYKLATNYIVYGLTR
jgi:hypothetical protein